MIKRISHERLAYRSTVPPHCDGCQTCDEDLAMANELIEARKELAELRNRFLIVADNSGHEYYIPVERSGEWGEFMKIEDEDPRSWLVPEFAKRIDGRFTFTDPRCE